MKRPVLHTGPVTADFCAGTADRVVFEPESVHEAAFIVRQLNAYGYRYYNAEYAAQLQSAVEGCLYLDTDKTIMVSIAKRDDGLLCTVDGFEQFYVPEGMALGEGRIPPAEFTRRKMVFYPRSAAEARGVFGALLAGGAGFGEAFEPGAPLPVARAVMQGLLVENGRIGFAPSAQDIAGAEICAAADIGVNAFASLSPEQVTIMAAFNEMAARMEQMAARLARLESEILPQQIEKAPPAAAKAPRPGLPAVVQRQKKPGAGT